MMVGGGGNDGVVSSSLCTIAIIHAQLLLLIVVLLSGRTRSNTHTHTFLELISSGGLSVGLCIEARSGRIGSDRIGSEQGRGGGGSVVPSIPLHFKKRSRHETRTALGSARLDSTHRGHMHYVERRRRADAVHEKETDTYIHTYIYSYAGSDLRLMHLLYYIASHHTTSPPGLTTHHLSLPWSMHRGTHTLALPCCGLRQRRRQTGVGRERGTSAFYFLFLAPPLATLPLFLYSIV